MVSRDEKIPQDPAIGKERCKMSKVIEVVVKQEVVDAVENGVGKNPMISKLEDMDDSTIRYSFFGKTLLNKNGRWWYPCHINEKPSAEVEKMIEEISFYECYDTSSKRTSGLYKFGGATGELKHLFGLRYDLWVSSTNWDDMIQLRRAILASTIEPKESWEISNKKDLPTKPSSVIEILDDNVNPEHGKIVNEDGTPKRSEDDQFDQTSECGFGPN